jgi:hypothetical protein
MKTLLATIIGLAIVVVAATSVADDTDLKAALRFRRRTSPMRDDWATGNRSMCNSSHKTRDAEPLEQGGSTCVVW